MNEGLLAFVVIFGGIGFIFGMILFFTNDVHIDIFNYFERRKKIKLEIIKHEKEKAIELAKINSQLELEKAKLEDTYWRDLSGIHKKE